MRTILAFLGTGAFALWISYDAVAASPDEIYAQKCAGCHGKDGKAQTAMGKKLGMKDLTDAKIQAAATDADWDKAILDGVKNADGKMIMPAYKGKVTPEEAKAQVKLCRDFKGK
jgi:mono/diheme cytochrome c family protein